MCVRVSRPVLVSDRSDPLPLPDFSAGWERSQSALHGSEALVGLPVTLGHSSRHRLP